MFNCRCGRVPIANNETGFYKAKEITMNSSVIQLLGIWMENVNITTPYARVVNMRFKTIPSLIGCLSRAE